MAQDAGLTCDYPILFAVTNFDPDDSAEQPNFDSIPENTKDHPWWGTFKRMTVRSSQRSYKSVLLDEKYEI